MLYELNRDNIESSKRIDVRSPAEFDIEEEDIENFLKTRLHEIVSADQLMLIAQERKRQEEPDLLALDKHGKLYIFELKRWKSNQENLLQVMRYGQIFGRYTYEQLEYHAKRQKRPKLEGRLDEKHKEYFELKNEEKLQERDFNQDQVFVLVTNGTDRGTISAVNYWYQKGVNIKCSPYRIFDINGKPFIQFDTYNPDDEVIPDENTGIFIVNTNKTYSSNAWKDMLGDRSTGKAAAYYGRKRSVCRISKGSSVYLYHTGLGVIACGRATSDYMTADYHGDKDEEFFIPLEFTWALDENDWDSAPRAWEINDRCNISHRFRQTAFSIAEDMAKAIDDIYKEKNECVLQ